MRWVVSIAAIWPISIDRKGLTIQAFTPTGQKIVPIWWPIRRLFRSHSIAKILELQRPVELGLLHERDRGLQVVA